MRKLRDLSLKNCPECQQKVGVAVKSCKCGHNFTRKMNPRSRVKPTPTTSTQRKPSPGTRPTISQRTGRVRTETKLFDSQEYDKKKKTKKSARAAAKATILNKQTEKDDEKRSREARAQQRRMKKEEIDDVDLADKMSTDKQELASIILAEINRKLGSVVWQPRF